MQSDPGPLVHTAQPKPGISNKVVTVNRMFSRSHSTGKIHSHSQHTVFTVTVNRMFSRSHSTGKIHSHIQHTVFTVTVNRMFSRSHSTGKIHSHIQHTVFTVNTKNLQSAQRHLSARKSNKWCQSVLCNNDISHISLTINLKFGQF